MSNDVQKVAGHLADIIVDLLHPDVQHVLVLYTEGISAEQVYSGLHMDSCRKPVIKSEQDSLLTLIFPVQESSALKDNLDRC